MKQQTLPDALHQSAAQKQDAAATGTLPENYQFNLSDFALFLSVMKVKEAYENVLSIILDEPDLKLGEVKAGHRKFF